MDFKLFSLMKILGFISDNDQGAPTFAMARACYASEVTEANVPKAERVVALAIHERSGGTGSYPTFQPLLLNILHTAKRKNLV
ncbi:hypothetical protein [Leptospira venezuelensis]|uniref:hypothetical protein n=1 Tax=Leptospira venezuelensis TaxID=1958811 RepID=UPI000A3A3D94